MSALHKEMERERAKYAAVRRRKEVEGAMATELNMDLLTNAIADDLRCQAALDVSPSVRASASWIPRICAAYTFRELTWALTRNAALGNPHACLRSPGKVFDSMLQEGLIL